MTKKAAQSTQTTKKNMNFIQKLLKGNGILWAGLVFFSIPVLILVVILLQSSLATGNVIEGNRFNNDLDPEITSTIIEETKSSLEALEFDSVSVNLHAATLLVTLKASPNLESIEFADLAVSVIEVIDEHIPLTTYFSASDAKKMYDLQVDIYNVNANDDSVNLHTILTKNANMTEWSIQDLSTAINPELAAELIAAMEEKNNPTTDTSIPTDSSDSTTESE